MAKFEEKTTSSKTIYEGRIIELRVDEVELPNGKTSSRELIKHPGAVAVIALTGQGKLVLVEQFRKALERTIIEIPAGKIDPGEDPERTAVRELEEETGYRAARLRFIQSFATSPGFADEIIHLYLAEDLERVDNPAKGDEDEFIDIHECTLKQAEAMMEDGRIYDAKTAFAVLYAKQLLTN